MTSLVLFSAKPIDLLAQYVGTEDNDLEIQMHEPYTILVVSSVDVFDLFCYVVKWILIVC